MPDNHVVTPAKTLPDKHSTSKESVSSDSFTMVKVDAEDIKPTSYYSIGLSDIMTSTQFVVFHTIIFDTIQAWLTDKAATKLPFSAKWKKALFNGLDR